MSVTHIRPATVKDLNTLISIETACFAAGDAFSRRQLRYILTRAQGIVFIAEYENVPAGYVSVLLRTQHLQGRIYSIAVSPEQRGNGIAETLLDKALAFAQERRVHAVFLEVGIDNSKALSLYFKKGFEKRGIKPNYYCNGGNAYSMVLRLT